MIAWLKERWLYIVAAIFSPFIIVWKLFQQLMDVALAGLHSFRDQLHAINSTLNLDASSFASYLQYANSFAPLNECLVMAGLWLGLRLLVVVVRLVKGLIPTLG